MRAYRVSCVFKLLDLTEKFIKIFRTDYQYSNLEYLIIWREAMIRRDSWKMIEFVIRRYPDSKQEYEEYIENIMASSPAPAIGVTLSEEYTKPQSVTEAKAIKLSSARQHRLKREIEAVELVYKNLRPEEQKVMRGRFWEDKKRNIPYTEIDAGYSEIQMRRIIKKIIIQIGTYIGEI